MNSIIVLLTILFISAIGYCIIWGFELLPKKDNLRALGYSYGLGVGAVSLQLYMYSRLSIPWQREFIIIPWVLLILSVLFKKREKNNK